jgi:hypothetical protein
VCVSLKREPYLFFSGVRAKKKISKRCASKAPSGAADAPDVADTFYVKL